MSLPEHSRVPPVEEASAGEPADRVSTGTSILHIFLTFTQITLSGFGGTGFWTRLMVIERRRWLTHREYVECMSVAQLLPGPNVFNLSVIVGHRLGGLRGAVAAITALILWPFLIMLAVGALYERYGELSLVQHALKGVSAVAIGLVLANAIKLASVLSAHWRPWLFLALVFVGVGVLRLPLLAVLAVLAPFAIAFAWREKR
jgi:chromate transporter